MMNAPKTIEEFINLKPWWKTPVSTRVVLSDDGVADLLRMLEDEGRRPFFVADKALEGSANSRAYLRKRTSSPSTRPSPSRAPATWTRCARL